MGYVKQPPPTHLRLKAEEETRVEQVRAALSRRMGGAPITKSHAMHVMLAKGYEALTSELGLGGRDGQEGVPKVRSRKVVTG